jgi:cytochrome c oxidase subunit 3
MAGVTGAVAAKSRPEASSPLSVGVMIWLASELMFFAGLFASWFVLRAANDGNWPPPEVEIDVARAAMATAVLILSSLTIHASVTSAERGRTTQARTLLFVTLALGTAFLVNLALEYRGLDFQLDSHAYGSIFYLLTGFHGAHVLGGLLAMGVLAWVVFSRGSRAPTTESLRVMSFYWHFVDVIWVILFVVVYVIG